MNEKNYPHVTKDSQGNDIYYKESDTYEKWMDYDEKGRMIHCKTSVCNEWWKKFDDAGNQIYFNSTRGLEWFRDYDNKGNVIHYKDNRGYEFWYNEKGHKISKPLAQLKIVRPKTRGELAERLKKGEPCEVAEYVSEMTSIMVKYWLGVGNFEVIPSPNNGWVIYVPTNKSI